MNYSQCLCMSICVFFSRLFYTYFLHKLHFSSKKTTLKPTWDVIRLIDSYINTLNVGVYPTIVVYTYYRHWLFISDLFNFHPKSDNFENGIERLNKVIFVILTN